MKSPPPPFALLSYNKKAYELSLWWIWLSGFVLIAVSFYVTSHVFPKPNVFENNSADYSISSPMITIFTAPTSFGSSVWEMQVLVVRSWLGLSPSVNVVLFTKDPQANPFAAHFGSRVSVESHIDFTFLGTPFFHSMVARSKASKSDISVIVDAETILLPDFISTLSHAHKLDHDWLLFSSSRAVSKFPFQLDDDGKCWLNVDSKPISTRKLQEYLGEVSQWNNCGERMLLAWNNGNLPLHNGVLPPFLFKKGIHNNWVINEAFFSATRFVFDASWAISTFNLEVSYSGNRSWEYAGNSHLASLYGSLAFHDFSYSKAVKIFECGGNYNFVDARARIVYPLGNKRVVPLRKKMADCVTGLRTLDGLRDCDSKDYLKLAPALSLPFTLEALLSIVADENKTLVLAIAGYSYKDMMMSWVCRLRHLMISNFVVCALDQEIYEFAVIQGIPVIRDPFAPTNVSFNDCHFGTTCFQRVTKVKSRIVLQILQMGYNVLLSDVDVYWLKDPLPYLFSFGPKVLLAQSDEYNITGPINLPRRLNSGFYFALSDSSTIAAMQKIVKHAALSNLSEQPSFYDTLCGEGGSYRVGYDQCFEPETNLTVHFLDRDLFPNGAYQGLWEVKDVKAACQKRECFVLHNNWISGRRKKLERQVLSGLWDYDISSRMCMHHWITEKSGKFDSSTERRPSYVVKDHSISMNSSIYSREMTVRIIHAGGRIEVYQTEILVSHLMGKYPGMCLAKPEVFKNPNESLLSSREVLLPGHKYFLIPSTTFKKLKRKHSEKVESELSDTSVCSSDFYVPKEKCCRSSPKKQQRKKKQSSPQTRKQNTRRKIAWEPSLMSIEEISP